MSRSPSKVERAYLATIHYSRRVGNMPAINSAFSSSERFKVCYNTNSYKCSFYNHLCWRKSELSRMRKSRQETLIGGSWAFLFHCCLRVDWKQQYFSIGMCDIVQHKPPRVAALPHQAKALLYLSLLYLVPKTDNTPIIAALPAFRCGSTFYY